MLNLRNVFELVINGFNDAAFSQQNLIKQGDDFGFHVFLELGDELNAKRLPELFKQGLGNVATIGDQLAKQLFAQCRYRFTIIDIAGCNLARQEFTTLIDDQMEFETVKPAHRTLAAISKFGEDLVIMDTMVVAHAQGGRVNEG